MSEKFEELLPKHTEFINAQHLYFVGTAGAEGRVNVSPKGMDSLRVLSPNRLIWLNMTGSGNETAAHVLENSRMTVMFCSFDKQPLILRAYGQAKVVYPRHAAWNELVEKFPSYTGARQIFELSIDLVQTSCGFAVPFYEYKGERETLNNWADNRGREGVKEYWEKKNLVSLDGKSTGISEDAS
ncbi:pyridoxamine 5'-phosphate oxidase family protein [Marinimicrobium sp. ABcell2]|uniref:pyridoxamine 5'-phosphate oxidase family protein n=1 Tax=Marinimicrobium sp. ABcell2 TaxID=3069751 RepID=UPI0027AFD0FA|nr:pyridoxamine 5'-phosphate oxidase family protein [Marinimicrobium sp. ABcell2]MDQ2078407.1 pyridoxamine 5'-phosphate oxidase family protein [Marinimicrobium sp. ABcell2]